jgi:CubicO group peptidase (beta-lactamase class C family)
LLAVLLLLPSLAVAQSAIDGHWSGEIDVPTSPLGIEIDFTSGDDGVLSGVIAIPAQQLRDRPLGEIAVDGTSVSFTIPGIPGNPSFDGTLDEAAGTISGTFRQGGAELGFSLARGAAPAEGARQALAGFDDFTAQAVKAWNVPGAAVAVVADGEVVFSQGFGYRDLEAELPVTEKTLFAIGSTTKAFTTTTLGMLADEGKLDWDEPLRTYIPSFALVDPMASERLTPRDLVTHRSGLPRHDLVWYNNNDVTRGELVARLAYLPPSAGFREKFQYNNLMFLTAGYLIEQLTGQSWEEAVRSRLLEPLGMTESNFSVHDSETSADFAQPYREDDDQKLERIPFRVADVMAPAGAINSSVEEMSRWLLFNLQGGAIDGKQLINPATLADLQSPHMVTGSTSTEPEISAPSYGMGWMVDTYRGHRRVHHGGAIDGFITALVLFPDDQVGIVAFTNAGSPLPALLANHAADRVLELPARDWNGEALARRQQGLALTEEAEKEKEATRVPGTHPTHELADYAGDYEDPGYGLLEVRLDGEQLALVYNGIEAPLSHWHYDVWNGAETDGDPTFENQKFQFRLDVDGNVASVESSLEPAVDPIVFKRRPDRRLSDPEYLARFTGTYRLASQQITISLAGDRLQVSLPGQPTYTLLPDLSGRFQLEGVSVISVEFAVGDDGSVTAARFYQPNGVYEAQRVEE